MGTDIFAQRGWQEDRAFNVCVTLPADELNSCSNYLCGSMLATSAMASGGIFDAGVMGWRVTDLAEHEAHEQAADLNVTFNQYGQRDQADRIEVKPPIEVQSATWSAAGQLDWWVKERREWSGRVRGTDGRQAWIKAPDLRSAKQGL